MKKVTNMKSLTSSIATLASLALTLAHPVQAQPADDDASQQKIEQVQQKIEQVQRKVEQKLAKAGQALALAQAGVEAVELPEPPEVSTLLNVDSDENGIVSAVFGPSGRNSGQPLIVQSSTIQ